jgi:hypothetical protein
VIAHRETPPLFAPQTASKTLRAEILSWEGICVVIGLGEVALVTEQSHDQAQKFMAMAP